MKTCTKCLLELPPGAFARNGPTALRPDCRACRSAYNKSYREGRAAEIAEQRKGHRKVNAEKLREQAKQKYLHNRGAVLESRKRYYAENKDRVRPKNRESARAHYQRNKDVYVAKDAARRSAKGRASPPWVDKQAVTAVYRLAREMREMGFDVEVDHIIPLIGEGVCGLHVEWNLQVIGMVENRSKGKSLPPPGEWLACPWGRWHALNSAL